ncbi:putative zinc finger protein, partial [Operophtera brumata]
MQHAFAVQTRQETHCRKIPALNLRQEARALFLKFGNLHQFHVSLEHSGEVFTETYHAMYDRIQSARIAKRMLDTKSFYGGSLHVSYAPELETLQETRQKLMQRKNDVLYRLRNLAKDKCIAVITDENNFTKDKCIREITDENTKTQAEVSCFYGNIIQTEVNTNQYDKNYKLDMGAKNIIYMNKRKASKEINIKKKAKPTDNSSIQVIDFTSTEKETLSNINEALNYNKFGDE